LFLPFGSSQLFPASGINSWGNGINTGHTANDVRASNIPFETRLLTFVPFAEEMTFGQTPQLR